MIDIIETQKRYGREKCFRLRDRYRDKSPYYPYDREDRLKCGSKGEQMIVEIDRVAPGELDKVGMSFWKWLAYARYTTVAIACERCGAIKMFSLRNSPRIPRLCKQCGGIALSAKRQGIHIDDWDGYATEQKYCKMFNESCKTQNRLKYDNRCFLCGKKQSDNITTTGKQKALSVHHVDLNKDQGCDMEKHTLICGKRG
jgi:hypothetical protein